MRSTTRSPRTTAGFGAAALLLLALAGCTGPAPSSSEGAGSPSGPTANESEIGAARDAYDLKMAQCLRDKGLDVKDPKPGEGITEDLPGINEAAAECRDEIGDPPVSDTRVDSAAVLKVSLEWAACLRDLGYEVEEPKLEQAFIVPDSVTEEDSAACLVE